MDGVRIRLSGSFAVENGDGPVVVGGRKSRRLLARLAAAHGGPVAVDGIVADLWPGAAPRGPADNVATLVSRLRAALGPDAVLGTRPAYRLGPAVRVDVTEAAALAAEAVRRAAEPALALAAARRGLDLLGDGGVLAGETADWVDELRREVGSVLRTLRHTAADAALQVGDPDAAVAAARAAADADRLDDRAHRLLMAAHHAAGEPDRALAAYDRLRTAVADELGADPAPATQELYLAVLRGDRPADPHPIPAPRPIPVPPVRPTPAGRDAELALLTATWTAVAAGRTALVLITGEAGIGKTTLAEAIAQVAVDTGGLVLRARCYAAERSLLLQPVLDALTPTLRTLPPAETRRLAGAGAAVLAGLVPELAGVLGEPDPARGRADLERRRTSDAVRTLLRSFAATRPVLLLLDDLHNAGTATVELLHYVAARPGADRLLLLATVRSEEGAEALDALDGVADRVEVGPLAADAVALLAARAGAPRLAEDILRRTRGHTLFVVETLRGLAAGETGVPDSLHAAVLARMRRVGPDVEQVLRAGAVLGAAVAPDTVAAMLGLPVPDVLQRLADATAARLLVPADDRYEFANDLVHEVLYASTSAPARHAYHRRAADLLADLPEVLAGHAAAAGDRGRAARAWLLAGRQAVERLAAVDGRGLLDRALDAAATLGDPALTGRILLARGLAHLTVGAFGPAATDLGAALDAAREAGERRLEMEVLRQLAGDVTSALGLSERALRLADAVRIADELDDPAAQADLYGWQAVVATNRLRFVDAIDLGERAVAAGRASGSTQALAAGLDGLKTAYAYLGDGVRLGPVLTELEPLLRRHGDLRVLHWAVFESALPLVAAAEWDHAVERITAAREINRRSGDLSQAAWLVAHHGWVERLRGRHEEALDLGGRAVELAEHRWWRVASHAMLATTLLELGRGDEAAGLLEAVRADAEHDGMEGYLLRCLAPLAEATGDVDVLRAAEALLAGVDTPPGDAWLTGGDAYLSVARARLARGEPDRARAVLAPLRAAAERHGWVPWQAAAALVDADALAAQGHRDASVACRAVAADLATRHGMPHLAADARPDAPPT